MVKADFSHDDFMKSYQREINKEMTTRLNLGGHKNRDAQSPFQRSTVANPELS